MVHDKIVLTISRFLKLNPDLWKDDRDPEAEGNGTLLFVYLWTLGLLVLLAVVGNSMVNRGHYDALRMALLGFANFAFIVMILVGGLGAIETEGREIEATGWYGQTSVLLFLTCLFGLVKSLVFAFVLQRKSKEASADDKQVELIGDGSPGATV